MHVQVWEQLQTEATSGCDKTQPKLSSHCEHKEGPRKMKQETHTQERFRHYYILKNYCDHAKYYTVQSTHYCIYPSWIFVSFMCCLNPETEYLSSSTTRNLLIHFTIFTVLTIKCHSLFARSPEENTSASVSPGTKRKDKTIGEKK